MVEVAEIAPSQVARPRQLRLFPVTNPLSEHLGDVFFRTLPRQAGVYFFYDEAGRLLYIGQSNNLRARVGSYRHVSWERHARRTLRLVHRVRRIEWEVCESGAAAIERERTLLLEKRPPFNRAGVWQAPPWWLTLLLRKDAVEMAIVRSETAPATAETVAMESGLMQIAARAGQETSLEAQDEGWVLGPFRGSFPFVYAALVRTIERRLAPSLRLQECPAGFLTERRVAPARLRRNDAPGSGAQAWWHAVIRFLRGEDAAFLQELMDATDTEETSRRADPGDAAAMLETTLWEADVEALLRFWDKARLE